MTAHDPEQDEADERFTPERYHLDLAAAFARGRLPALAGLDDEAAVRAGAAAGLRLFRFKRTHLPRVQRVLGLLRGLYPASLLDVGSGRGTFLWPLLDALPAVPVTSVDRDALRAQDLGAVARELPRLTAVRADVEALPFASGAFDGVTVLEVLEHVRDPARAAAEALRVARRFVVATVPSTPDDNPEHLRLFTAAALEALLRDAGARRVSVTHVLNHRVAVAMVGGA